MQQVALQKFFLFSLIFGKKTSCLLYDSRDKLVFLRFDWLKNGSIAIHFVHWPTSRVTHARSWLSDGIDFRVGNHCCVLVVSHISDQAMMTWVWIRSTWFVQTFNNVKNKLSNWLSGSKQVILEWCDWVRGGRCRRRQLMALRSRRLDGKTYHWLYPRICINSIDA